MAQNNRRRNTIIALVILIIVILLLLLRCQPKKPSTPAPTPTPAAPTGTTAPAKSPTPAAAAPDTPEVLTPATITAPETVIAGAVFSASWTGPDNLNDYITIVPKDAAPDIYASNRETKHGKSVDLTAPIEPGAYEVRYIAAKSRTILGRAPIQVTPMGAAITAPAEVILGSKFDISWTGPNNKGDYITVVPKENPDEKYGSYVDADKPTPQLLTAPSAAGEAELRYITGQGKKVLTRRPIKVIMPEVELTAPADAIAGTTLQVTWTGPNNSSDYITIVAAGIPDGQYGNYTNTSNGSPLKLLMPIMSGNAELRYMTGQGGKVLARRPINITAAEVTLAAPPESMAAADVSITWTGPSNSGDYITIVTKATPDGQYAAYAVTANGSPLTVKAPKEPGDAEIRYMTGQGNKVLKRIPIKIVP